MHCEYCQPKSLEEAWELKRKFPEARFIAGGSELMVKIKNRSFAPAVLISLRSIPELSRVEVGGVTRIGGMVTFADLIRHPQLGSACPLLAEAAQNVGSAQIRNVATIGGNVCNASPCADSAIALLVLEARAVLRTPQTSREVPLRNFFSGARKSCLQGEEILTEFLLDTPDPEAKATFMKKGRVKMDLAVASLAALLKMEGKVCRKARFAAGSVAPVPLRLVKVEALLENAEVERRMIPEAQRLAVESISPISDIRSTAEYRRQIISAYVRRSIQKLLGWEDGQ